MNLRDKIPVLILVAFCSYMAVHADLKQDLLHLEATYVTQVLTFDLQLTNNVTSEANTATLRGLTQKALSICMNKFNTDKSTASNLIDGKLDDCHTNPKYNKNKKDSEECLQRVLGGYKDEVGGYHDELTSCMTNCVTMQCE